MEVHEFNKALYAFLGECGAEAVIDAINYYLLHNKKFPCEEDKLILLSILFDSPYAVGYYPEHNALMNMHITIGGDTLEN